MAKDGVTKLKNKGDSGQSNTQDAKQKRDVSSASSKSFGYAPMLTLLLFSTLMLVLPMVTYFGIRQFIVDSTTISAMGAIVMVQLIVAAYIYKAWNDETREHESQQKDKLKKR